ncbi:MAG: hypothetical protein WAW82_08445 [Candidatus Lutibacillus vidarii]|jgi:hypothetical protein
MIPIRQHTVTVATQQETADSIRAKLAQMPATDADGRLIHPSDDDTTATPVDLPN